MKKGEHRTFNIYRDEKGMYQLTFFEKKPFLGKLKIRRTAEAVVPGVAHTLHFMTVWLMTLRYSMRKSSSQELPQQFQYCPRKNPARQNHL